MKTWNFTAGCPTLKMTFRTVETLMGLIIAVLIAAPAPAAAQGKGGREPDHQEARDDAPTLELLEFLGEWETDEGLWVDPTRFDSAPVDDLEMEHDTPTDDERPSR